MRLASGKSTSTNSRMQRAKSSAVRRSVTLTLRQERWASTKTKRLTVPLRRYSYRPGAGGPVPGRQTKGILRPHPIVTQRRQIGRKRLGRRQHFAGDAALRRLPFLDRQHRLPRLPVENKDEALLGALDDDIAPLAIERDRGERGLRSDVVIPDIVMHGLEAPESLASVGVQRHHGVA